MRIFAFSVILLLLAFIVHLVVWRIAIPRRQARALLVIFAIVPCLFVAACHIAPIGLWKLAPTGLWEWLHVGTFYVAFALAYVVVYSAIEERSPSMTLLSHAAQSLPRGCSRAELEAVLEGASPVEVRLTALERDGLVDEQCGICELTPKGRVWSATFETLRWVLGFSRGG